MRLIRIAAAALLALAIAAPEARAQVAAAPIPIFDAHLHYNWEPTPRFDVDEVLKLFREAGIRGILATSRPNIGTHALLKAKAEGKAPDLWIVPFIRPYRVRPDIGTWFGDPATMTLIEEQSPMARFAGIGEFHLSGAAGAAPLVRQVTDIALKNDWFLHAHADEEALVHILTHAPNVRLVWAHTGFSVAPRRVAELLEKHPNLVGELSYRGGITEGGRLSAEWRDLFMRHPTRFLLGSDTWIPQRWESYREIMADYRNWLGQLPRDVAENIAWRNAERLFARWREAKN